MKNVRAAVYDNFVGLGAPRGFIFVSGQVSRNGEGNRVGTGGMLEQTRQCLRNIGKSLVAAGGSLADPGLLVEIQVIAAV